MNFAIWFSWPAWWWVNTAWLMLANLLAKKWYNVLVDKEYASVIKWDNNFIAVYFSDDKFFISKKLDYFICFDDYSITKNEKVYDLWNIVNLKTQPRKFKNIPAFGYAIKLLWIDLAEWEEIVRQEFAWKSSLEDNLNTLKEWFELCTDKEIWALPNIWDPKVMYFGNEIIGKWAIASGLWRYSAYPMTPASSIIDVVTWEMSKWNVKNEITFFQWEDEIAVAMSMLWAKFAWKRAMCGTSGWWFALMTESLSFSNQAEIWWVFVLSQRDGPSTGTPTYTWQWDIDDALNASFGETFPIVIAPDTFENGYNLVWKALNRSDKYQHPIIYLVDKQYSESYISINEKDLKAEPILQPENVDLSNNDYNRYKDTESWISPYVVPWTVNWEFIATSYEHDESWASSEDPEMKSKMMAKRSRKMKTFIDTEFNDNFYWYEIINPNAEKFYVSFGFNRYVLEDCIKWNQNTGLIIITVFQPLDPRLKTRLNDHENQIKQLTFVEMNENWSLERLIKNECNLKSPNRENKINHIRKFNLYPIFKEDLN